MNVNTENENRNDPASTPGSEGSSTGIPNSELGTQNCPVAPEPSTADPTGCPFLPPPPRRRGPASKVASLPLDVQALGSICELIADLDLAKAKAEFSEKPQHLVGLLHGLTRIVTGN